MKKPSDRFLRVCAKNQLGFEIFGKIYILKSQWKIDFLPIFSPIFSNLAKIEG